METETENRSNRSIQEGVESMVYGEVLHCYTSYTGYMGIWIAKNLTERSDPETARTRDTITNTANNTFLAVCQMGVDNTRKTCHNVYSPGELRRW